jgi:hypothetical protein
MMPTTSLALEPSRDICLTGPFIGFVCYGVWLSNSLISTSVQHAQYVLRNPQE